VAPELAWALSRTEKSLPCWKSKTLMRFVLLRAVKFRLTESLQVQTKVETVKPNLNETGDGRDSVLHAPFAKQVD
jgi:hypothetical protein